MMSTLRSSKKMSNAIMLSLWERRRMRCSQMFVIEHHFNLNSSNERTTLAMLIITLDGRLNDWSFEKQ